jgi:hypothetical protein
MAMCKEESLSVPLCACEEELKNQRKEEKRNEKK